MGNESVKRMLDKYRKMLKLCLERERCEAEGVMRLEGEQARLRQESSRTLAQSYPGALKQLDGMDSANIERRLEVLETHGANGGEELPRWCELEDCFHILLHDVLAAKRWLAEHRDSELSDTDVWASWQAAGLFEARVWQAGELGETTVETVRSPPGGRLTSFVWKTLGEYFREPPDVLKAEFSAWQEDG